MHVVLGLEVVHGLGTTQDQNSDCTIATPSLMTAPVFDWVAYLGPGSVLLHCFFFFLASHTNPSSFVVFGPGLPRM
jgi:hypothetical protein